MKVLIAEDEEALLQLFEGVVRSMGHSVVTAVDGEDALELARAEIPDLIVSDFMMPRLTGVDLLNAVRADPNLADTPFILVSGVSAEEAQDGEADTYLEKPVDLGELENAVRERLSAVPDKKKPVTAPKPENEGEPRRLSDEMLSWVAHEIKTPLSSARLNIELMQRRMGREGKDDEKKRSDAVLRQIARIEELINAVLEAARLSEGRLVLQKERRDLGALIAKVVSHWRDAQPSHELIVQMPTGPLPVDIDEERLRAVLDNLLSNAIKYGKPSKRIEISVVPSPATVEVKVRDFGPGIDASELPHLFERFRRAQDKDGRGHGFGLFIAAEIARLHGGALKVESERGEGSTFILVLPRPT